MAIHSRADDYKHDYSMFCLTMGWAGTRGALDYYYYTTIDYIGTYIYILGVGRLGMCYRRKLNSQAYILYIIHRVELLAR